MEAHDTRLKRLRMRSSRRGTKEMDILLMRYADLQLSNMDAASLDTYEAMLSENDQDLYQWITGQADAPAEFAALIADIKARAAGPSEKF